MELENVLKALELSINGRIDELDEKLLKERNVQETLTTYFAEQQARPELTALIRAQSLMHEYLKLSLEEREELEWFRQNHPEYIDRESNDFHNSLFKSEKTEILAKKQRYLNQLLKCFDFYLENREENEVFNANYLARNNRLKERFSNFGQNLYQNVKNNLKEEGGISYIIQLAAQQSPEILKYWQYQGKRLVTSCRTDF